jgi:hypothetical protein
MISKKDMHPRQILRRKTQRQKQYLKKDLNDFGH